MYDDIGIGFIHIHHMTPLHKIDVAYQVDPEKDLISFCANCHTMFDRSNNPPTLEKLKDAMRKQESI